MARLHSRSTVNDIEARLTTLDGKANCTKTAFPNNTHEGKSVHYLKIRGGASSSRLPVCLVGGVHGREVAIPPALTNFAEDLIDAYNASGPMTAPRFVDNSGLISRTFPEYVIPWSDVRRIVENLDLFITPLTNPDGREFELTSLSNPALRRKILPGWRKNRRPAPGSASCTPVERRPGVDLNRNFNIGWDISTYYNSSAESNVGLSNVHCDDSYRGPSAASEPEVENIQHLIDTEEVKFFADLHAFGPMIMIPWGMEDNQSSDSTKNFQNSAWDRSGAHGGRDGVGGATYGEFFPNGSTARILDEHTNLSHAMRDAIRNDTGSVYESIQIADLATRFGKSGFPGSTVDYAFSRQFISGWTGTPVYAFALEFGSRTRGAFHPLPGGQYEKVEREIYIAMHELLKYAAAWHAPLTAPPPSSGSPCFIATAAYGSAQHGDVVYLRSLRESLRYSGVVGRWFIHSVEKVYYSFSPIVADFIRQRQQRRLWTRNLVVKPVVKQIRFYERLARLMQSRTAQTTVLIVLLSMALLLHMLTAAGLSLGLFTFISMFLGG